MATWMGWDKGRVSSGLALSRLLGKQGISWTVNPRDFYLHMSQTSVLGRVNTDMPVKDGCEASSAYCMLQDQLPWYFKSDGTLHQIFLLLMSQLVVVVSSLLVCPSSSGAIYSGSVISGRG